MYQVGSGGVDICLPRRDGKLEEKSVENGSVWGILAVETVGFQVAELFSLI